MSARWLVERARDDFEDVGAEHFAVLPCGAIEFYNGTAFEKRDRIVYAPGQWVTVCETEE